MMMIAMAVTRCGRREGSGGDYDDGYDDDGGDGGDSDGDVDGSDEMWMQRGQWR